MDEHHFHFLINHQPLVIAWDKIQTQKINRFTMVNHQPMNNLKYQMEKTSKCQKQTNSIFFYTNQIPPLPLFYPFEGNLAPHIFYKSPPSCLRAIPSIFFGVHELLEYSHTCMCDRCTQYCPGSGMGECVACQGQAWYTPISVPSSASPSWDENSNMPHRGQGWYLHFRSITLWPS